MTRCPIVEEPLKNSTMLWRLEPAPRNRCVIASAIAISGYAAINRTMPILNARRKLIFEKPAAALKLNPRTPKKTRGTQKKKKPKTKKNTAHATKTNAPTTKSRQKQKKEKKKKKKGAERAFFFFLLPPRFFGGA